MTSPDTPDSHVRRVSRWRTVLVSTALTASLALTGLIGTQVASAGTTEDGTSVAGTASSSSSSSSTTDSGVSAGSSTSFHATSGGS